MSVIRTWRGQPDRLDVLFNHLTSMALPQDHRVELLKLMAFAAAQLDELRRQSEIGQDLTKRLEQVKALRKRFDVRTTATRKAFEEADNTHLKHRMLGENMALTEAVIELDMVLGSAETKPA